MFSFLRLREDRFISAEKSSFHPADAVHHGAIRLCQEANLRAPAA
jgi:hypothetical protein